MVYLSGYPNWIIVLFFFHIDAFKVEKVEEKSHKTTKFGEFKCEIFRDHIKASNAAFWSKKKSS